MAKTIKAGSQVKYRGILWDVIQVSKSGKTVEIQHAGILGSRRVVRVTSLGDKR